MIQLSMQIVWLPRLVKNPRLPPAVCNCRLEGVTVLPMLAWGFSILFMACAEWRDMPLR